MKTESSNPAYAGMTSEQIRRFKYWEFRTIAMCIFGYALFYFVRKNLSIAMPYLNEEMGISKSDLGLFLTLHGVIYGLSKFVNGIWGDRSDARRFLVTGLVFCAICNLLFGFSSSVAGVGHLLGPQRLVSGHGRTALHAADDPLDRAAAAGDQNVRVEYLPLDRCGTGHRVLRLRGRVELGCVVRRFVTALPALALVLSAAGDGRSARSRNCLGARA